MKIKMVDLHGQYLGIKDEIDEAIKSVLDSGQFINGIQLEQFTKEFADYLNVNHVIPCANGTDALQIGIMALDFKPGDEIIMPSYNYISAAEVAVLLGLKPVFVDVDRQTFNIDVSQIEGCITSKTVAILPVHLYGQCTDMEPILRIADQYKLAVIEDNAQSIGAEYTFSDGRVMKAGTMGTIGTTSFYPTKNLGCYGDGGALMINDRDLAEKCRSIANHGQSTSGIYDMIGINSRLDELQAAILRVKLRYLEEFINYKRNIADMYNKAFEKHPKIESPFRAPYSTHTYYKYVLRVAGWDLSDYLKKNGIPDLPETAIPIHFQPLYKSGGDFPVCNDHYNSVLTLPIHSELTEEKIDFVLSKFILYINGK